MTTSTSTDIDDDIDRDVAQREGAQKRMKAVPLAERIRCGDTVNITLPGGRMEQWVCAYADYDRNEFAWMGWPPGWTELDRVTLAERCSDEEHKKHVEQYIAQRGYNESQNRRRVLELYAPRVHAKEQYELAKQDVVQARERLVSAERQLAEWAAKLAIVALTP